MGSPPERHLVPTQEKLHLCDHCSTTHLHVIEMLPCGAVNHVGMSVLTVVRQVAMKLKELRGITSRWGNPAIIAAKLINSLGILTVLRRFCMWFNPHSHLVLYGS